MSIFPIGGGDGGGGSSPVRIGANRLVNGDFSVHQYPAGAVTVVASDPKVYSTDMWYLWGTGGNFTGERITQGNNEYRYQLTGGSGNTRAEIGQRIEADYTAGLNGNTCTLSFLTESDTLTEIKYQISYPTTTKNVFGTKASPTVTSIASGTIEITSTESRYDVQVAVPGAADTGIEVILFAENFTSGTWVVGDVQLEEGEIATPFEREDIAITLNKCLRYYERLDSTGLNPVIWSNIWSGNTSSGAAYYADVRITPKLTSAVTISGILRQAGFGSVTLDNISNQHFLVTGVANVTAGGCYIAYENLTVSCEL